MENILKIAAQKLRYLSLTTYYNHYKKQPINQKQVLFLSQSRKELSGNFYYIRQAMQDRFIVKSVLSDDSITNKMLAKLMAESHYILLDDFYPAIYPVHLREETRLIQVWHAIGAFKTVGYARKNSMLTLTHRGYTDAIVSSPSIINDYARAFHMDPRHIHPIGIPRSDIFFDETYAKQIKEELYQQHPQLENKKIILFAPTFRGNNIHHAYYDYDQIDFKHLQESLGDDYFCIIKMHPFIKQRSQALDSHFFLDLSSQREINDLLFITDILITDYSSVIFEASLLNIPTIFFAYDLENYISERDFFYPYEEYTYGPVVKNEEELVKAIRHPVIDQQKLERFKEKFVASCDGHASERFVEVLLEGGKL